MEAANPNSIKEVRKRVLVVGASPDATNPNVVLRALVAQAFQTLSSTDQIRCVAFEDRTQAAIDFKPHLIVVFGSCAPTVCEYQSLAYVAKSIRAHLAFWVHEDPYEFDHHVKFMRHADTIFTNDRATVPYYKRDRVFHLPMAAAKSIHYRPLLDIAKRSYDVFFCGAAFPNRRDILDRIQPTLEEHRAYICGRGWPSEKSHVYHNHRIEYRKLPDYYSQSRVVLNIGRQYDLANRLNIESSTPAPRTFEAAMAGCVQLYLSVSAEIQDYFSPGMEIIRVESADEAADRLRVLCTSPEMCLQIAANAQARALREHSYRDRVMKIVALCGLT